MNSFADLLSNYEKKIGITKSFIFVELELTQKNQLRLNPNDE